MSTTPIAVVLLALAALLGIASATEPAGLFGGSWGGRRGGGSSGGYHPPGYYWPPKYSCRERGCFTPCPNPPKPTTAWDFISTNPELSFFESILAGTKWQTILDQPTDYTVLAPTNAAFDDFFFNQLSSALLVVLSNDADRTSLQYKYLLQHFFPILVQYFILPEPVFAKDLEVGQWYDTVYSNPNGQPHKIYFGSKDVPVAYGVTVSRYAKPCRSCKNLKYYLMDEQRKTVTIKQADFFAEGGGAVHVINGIPLPNDIYPSVLTAMHALNFTAFLAVVDYSKDSAWGRNAWAFTETNPITMAIPNNAAVAAWNKSLNGVLPTPVAVRQQIQYQNCPIVGPDVQLHNLLYTPFTVGTNPCLTALGLGQSNPALQLDFTAIGSEYTVSALPGDVVANIVFPDITTPLSVLHGIDTFIVPPN